jgi:hypothetical protein
MAAELDVHSRRELLSLGLLGVLLAAGGCGGGVDGGSGGAASSEDQTQQTADRDARQRAYGAKTSNPGKTKPKS